MGGAYGTPPPCQERQAGRRLCHGGRNAPHVLVGGGDHGLLTSPAYNDQTAGSNGDRSSHNARGHIVEIMARRSTDLPPEAAVVVINPDDEVTPESFIAWLDQLQHGEPLDLGVTAAETLGEV